MFKTLKEKTIGFITKHPMTVTLGVSIAIVIGLSALTDASHLSYAAKWYYVG